MITIKNIKKRFGNIEVLKGIDLTVHKGEVIVILGPSGSGKSTFLRCLNFLEKADSGSITIQDQTIDVGHASKHDMTCFQRQTAMVFQNYALFANKTAKENIALPLILTKNKSRLEAEQIADAPLDKVGLSDRANYYPIQMSGGQQQRIGIARALGLNPEVMLLDEPTSALDPELVGQILGVIKRIAKSGATMILVTHEIGFAHDIADKVVFMEKGHIVETGKPGDILNHPKELRTKEFLGRFSRKMHV